MYVIDYIAAQQALDEDADNGLDCPVVFGLQHVSVSWIQDLSTLRIYALWARHGGGEQRSISSFQKSSKCAHHVTHCGLVIPYGDQDLGQHWLR